METVRDYPESPVDGAEARKHNATAPVHSLPAEIFLDILFISINFTIRPLISQLHVLAQVCRYWFHSIITNSRFWCAIDFENQDFVSVVLRRNPSGPLLVRCHFRWHDSPADAFLEVAQTQAQRLDHLHVSGVLEERHMDHFRSLTPALKVLDISNHHLHTQIFPLSDTSTLRHICVRRIGLPWDSLSLRGLKSISITSLCLHSPSLRQIVTMLFASPGLEWLTLEAISYITFRDDEVPEQTIYLPALRGLELRPSVAPFITHHLLKTINGPHCHTLDALISFESLRHPGPTFTKFVSTPMQMAKRLRVEYDFATIKLDLNSSIQVYRPGTMWRNERRDVGVRVSMKDIPYSAGSLDVIANTLALSAGPTEVELVFSFSHDATTSKIILEDYDSILWRLTTNIEFGQRHFPQIAATLRFLANPVITNEHVRWPCPRLLHITIWPLSVDRSKKVVDALQELLTKRSRAAAAAVDDGSAADTLLDIPVPVRVIEGNLEMLELIRGTGVAEGIHLDQYRRESD